MRVRSATVRNRTIILRSERDSCKHVIQTIFDAILCAATVFEDISYETIFFSNNMKIYWFERKSVLVQRHKERYRARQTLKL